MTEAAELLRREGYPQVADDLLRSRSLQPRRPVLLVAGETNSGKSSLVNALLRRPDLSPTGAEVTTAAPISLVYADPARSAVVRYGEPEAVGLDAATSGELARVERGPGGETIRGVQIGTPCPLLERLVVIDSPGLGGLASGFGELTLQTLGLVDALLFVTPADTPVRDSEVDFLQRASRLTDTIIVAVTKIDLQPAGQSPHDTKVADLTAQLPGGGGIRVVAVDSELALRALVLRDLPLAAAQRNESGFNALQDAVRELVIDPAPTVFEADQIRELIWPLAAAAAALADAPAAAADNATEAAGDGGFGTYAQQLYDQRARAGAAAISDLRRSYEVRLADSRAADGIARELLADLSALAGRLNQDAARRLTAFAERAIETVEPVAAVQDAIRAVASERVTEQLASMQLRSPRITRSRTLCALWNLAAGHAHGTWHRTCAVTLLSGPIVDPSFDLGIGYAVGAGMGFGRLPAAAPNGAVDVGAWVGEQCDIAARAINDSLSRAVAAAAEEIRGAVQLAAGGVGIAHLATELDVAARREAVDDLLRRAIALLDAIVRVARAR